MKVRAGFRAGSGVASPQQGSSSLRDAQAANDEKRELIDRYNQLCEILKQKQRDQLIAQKAYLAAPRDEDKLPDASPSDEAAAVKP